MKQTISALVMIYNEERQIADCLDTLKWCDEIIICDSFSTDRTIEICRRYTDRIYQRKFDDFGRQKEWMMDKPACDWVLFVEADERFPAALAAEIREKISFGGHCDGYWMDFRNFAFGRLMKGDFWRFRKIKLYRRGKGRWEKRAVHGGFSVDGPVGSLGHPVDHYPYPTAGVFLKKLWFYSRLEAAQLAASGKRQGSLELLKSVAWVPMTFCRHFFRWHGYRDGWSGFMVALLGSPYNLFVQLHYRSGRYGNGKTGNG